MKIRKEVDLHSLPTDNNRIKIQINLIKVVQIFVLVLLGPRYYGNAEIPIKKSANFSGNFRTSQFFSLFFAISNLFRPSCVLYGSKQHIVPRPYTHTHTPGGTGMSDKSIVAMVTFQVGAPGVCLSSGCRSRAPKFFTFP